MRIRELVAISAAVVAVLTMSATVADAQVLKVQTWDGAVVKGAPFWDKIVAGFEAQHPGVTIETNFVPFGQYLPTLQAMTAGGALPDVFYGGTKVKELGAAGLTVNYKDYFDEAFFSGFFPGPLRQFTYDKGEHIYGLPTTAQMFAIFVNKRILKENNLAVPDTWDELLAMTPALRAKGITPLAWGNGEKNMCPDVLLPLVTQNGGDVYALDEGLDPSVNWNSPPVVKALAQLGDMAKKGVFFDGINGIPYTAAYQIAFEGKAAIIYAGSFLVPIIDQQGTEDFINNYEVFKTPAQTKDSVHWAGDGSGESWVVAAKNPNKDLALEFVKYFYSDAVYDAWIKGLNQFPARKDSVDMVTNPNLIKLLDWMTSEGSDHILYGKGRWDAISNVCQSTLDGSISPEEGAAKIQADIELAEGR